ncbi:unnamed protein product, partial [Polarella glacialis]
QSVRPHIWYFAVSDCDKSLQNFTHRLKFEFHALQENGSEFSIEMRGMLLCNSLFLACFTVFIWFFVQRTLDFNRKTGNVHPVIWVLAIGMLTQYLAQVFHTLHLWAYKFDGDGIKPLEVLSEILFMLSQVTQTSLLILIGLGYTLLQSRIGELDLMIPMCFMVGVIHIMLVGFGKIKDDAAYKFHENEGPVGWILLTMRLLLFGWFLWAVQASARDGGSKVRNFLDQFRIAGSIYFLAYPTIFLAAKMFAPYLQHGVMSVGLMLMQAGPLGVVIVVAVVVVFLLLSKRRCAPVPPCLWKELWSLALGAFSALGLSLLLFSVRSQAPRGSESSSLSRSLFLVACRFSPSDG